MGIPQIIIIVLLALGFGISIAKDGESKGNYSAGWTFLSTAIWVGILWWGGFWN